MCIFNDEESKRIEIIMEKLTGPVTESKKEKTWRINEQTKEEKKKGNSVLRIWDTNNHRGSIMRMALK
jgi:hypothetical protein